MSHGRLIRHEFAPPADLSGATLGDLGAELLSRIGKGEKHSSRQQLEKHLSLLSRLHDATGALMEAPENRESIAHFAAQFHFVHHCWRKHGVPIAGATHVDIGCGALNPLARLFTHVMLGARRVVGIDMDPPVSLPDATRNLARLAAAAIIDPTRLYGSFPVTGRDVMFNLNGFDLAKLQRGEPDGMPPTRVVLQQTPIESTGLTTASVDVVISNSVLEHLDSLDPALAEMARITQPGGYGIHGIDTIDHRWYGEPGRHPLDFLTIDTSDAIVFGCNRIRLVEFPAIFRRNGFEVVDYWTHKSVAITPDFRARLVEPWASMPDEALETTWANVLVRRLPN